MFAAEEQLIAAIDGGGSLDDNHHSFVYYAETGEFAFDRGFPSMTWEQLDLASTSGIFVFHENANPIFTVHNETNLSTSFGLSITSISIGLVSQPDLTEAFLLSDLTGFASCGPTCDPAAPDLVYIPRVVPEPAMIVLVASALLMLPTRRGSRAPVSTEIKRAALLSPNSSASFPLRVFRSLLAAGN
jgi:hypothetical protein